MILYRTGSGLFLEEDNQFYTVGEHSLDALFAMEDLHGYLKSLSSARTTQAQVDLSYLEAPIEHQEVWASGVT